MKKYLNPEAEQEFRKDMNLREALRRRYADEPQLPVDFARKLQERICAENEKRHVGMRVEKCWRNVAAIIAGVLLVSGAVFAVVRWGGMMTPEAEAVAGSDSMAAKRTKDTKGAVVFDDVPLDSILTVVVGHYGKAVCFRDEEPKALRLSTSWKMEESLGMFVNRLNEFDGLRLTEERDTVFVEQIEEEDEE